MNTSLGFHTFTIYMKLTVEELEQVYQAFSDCKETYFVNKDKDKDGHRRRHELIRRSDNGLPDYFFPDKYYNVKYQQRCTGFSLPRDKGLSWTMRYCRSSPEFMKVHPIFGEEDRSCSIRATINPKILLGFVDYIAAADSNCLNRVIEVFNREARKISPILKDFSCYSLNRNDYCVNFDLAELGINCHPIDYMRLIKQSDRPHYFKEEFKKYDTKSHRNKSSPTCLYLMNNSVHVNCYCKHDQLEKLYPDTPYIDDAFNVIRFEIQCKYLKAQYMQRQIKDCDDFEEKMTVMLSDECCTNLLKSYYYKTIGAGDYYTLDGARDKIKSMNYRANKENRLIDALNLVNKHRGVFKAKSQLANQDLKEFKRTLNDLGESGINPITIPRELRIKHLPNLMEAYLDQREKQEAAWAAAYPKNIQVTEV